MSLDWFDFSPTGAGFFALCFVLGGLRLVQRLHPTIRGRAEWLPYPYNVLYLTWMVLLILLASATVTVILFAGFALLGQVLELVAP